MYDPYTGWEYPSAIAHHGIKGQKWYRRRFQNPDGSLTSAGKARYAKNPQLSDKDRSKLVKKFVQREIEDADARIKRSSRDKNVRQQGKDILKRIEEDRKKNSKSEYKEVRNANKKVNAYVKKSKSRCDSEQEFIFDG